MNYLSRRDGMLFINQLKTITMRTIERILDVVYLAVLTTAVVLTIVMLATGHAHASFTSVG